MLMGGLVKHLIVLIQKWIYERHWRFIGIAASQDRNRSGDDRYRASLASCWVRLFTATSLYTPLAYFFSKPPGALWNKDFWQFLVSDRGDGCSRKCDVTN